MLGSLFSDIYDTLYSQVVDIPVNNALGLVYVLFNFLATTVLTLFGYSSENGIFSLFGGY